MANPFLTSQLDTLKEAFPTLDSDIIEHVLDSHRGHVEPAFETLLGMTDPSISTSTSTSASTSASYSSRPLPPRNAPRHVTSTSNLASRAPHPPLTGQRANSNQSATNPFVDARQEFAQWRQDLAKEPRSRIRARRPDPPRHVSTSSSSPSGFSSTIPQDWRNYHRDRSVIKDAIATSTAAVKAASHLVNTTTAYYQGNRSRPSDTASIRSVPADPPFRAYALTTQSETTLSQNNTGISRSRPLPPRPPSQHHNSSRERPLPNRPVPSVPSVRRVPVQSPSPQRSASSSTNPFDPSADDSPPPPAYESHHQDAYIDPQDVDRVLRQRAA